MKSKLFRGNLSTRKGEVPFFMPLAVNISIKYSSVAVTKFIWKEIWQKNNFTLLQEKESKLLYSYCIPFNEQQKCHVTNNYT